MASILSLFGYKKRDTARRYVVLLLGETGSGKSTLINYLTNYFNGGTLTDPRIAIPNRYYSATESSSNSEKFINDQTKSKTSKCTTYGFTLEGQAFDFIDSPGLSDTEGVAQDDNNIDCILDIAEKTGVLSAIVIIINGTVARATVNLGNTLGRLRGNLPDVLVDNLIVVLTNCTETNYNFDFQSLQPWKIKKENVFIMDNSALSRDPSVWQNNARAKKGVQEAWNTSMEEIQKMVYRLTDLDEKSTGVFKDLRTNRNKIKAEMHGVLLEINKLQRTQNELEMEQNNHRAAIHDTQRYSNFKQSQEVEYTELVDAEYYSTICMIHSKDRVCHDHCSLPETEQPGTGVHIKCYCMDGPRCRVCECEHEQHYHARKKLGKRKETVETILEDVKREHDNATVRVRNAHSKVTKLSDDLRLVEQTLQEKQAQIEQCCIELQRICSAFNFADEMAGVLQALKTNAKTLMSLKARQEADNMIGAIESLVERLRSAKSNNHTKDNECDGYYSNFDSGLARSRIGALRQSSPEYFEEHAERRSGDTENGRGRSGCQPRNANVVQKYYVPRSTVESSDGKGTDIRAPQRIQTPCDFYNRISGCNKKDCRYRHICAICARDNHTAMDCRHQNSTSASAVREVKPQNPGVLTVKGGDRPCRYYNREGGCRNKACEYPHKCSECGMLDHGASDCRMSKPSSTISDQTKLCGACVPGTCYEFNRFRTCKFDPCPYKHLCGYCGQLHRAVDCKHNPNN